MSMKRFSNGFVFVLGAGLMVYFGHYAYGKVSEARLDLDCHRASNASASQRDHVALKICNERAEAKEAKRKAEERAEVEDAVQRIKAR